MAISSRMLDAENMNERIKGALGDKVRDVQLRFGHADITCNPGDLVEVALALRDRDELQFTFFTFLSGVDRTAFGDEESEGRRELEVLIHLFSPAHISHVNIHVPIPLENPVCPSLTGVFLGAEWAERETFEMYGILFDGHPHLVNLYLPEDFEGHPLRKSFKLPSRFVKAWPGAKDPEEAAAGGGRA